MHASTHPHQQIAPPAVANVPLLVGLIYLMQRRARARPLRSNGSGGGGGGETSPPTAPAPLSPLCASLAALWPPSLPLLKGSRRFLRGAPAITGLGGASHPGRMKTPFFTFLSFFSAPRFHCGRRALSQQRLRRPPDSAPADYSGGLKKRVIVAAHYTRAPPLGFVAAAGETRPAPARRENMKINKSGLLPTILGPSRRFLVWPNRLHA